MTTRREGEKKPIEIRKYDHGTVWALSEALNEALSVYPSNHSLESMDDDDRSGRRIMIVTKHATIADIRRWRTVLATYGIHRKPVRK